ncbi:MAG: CDP-diacylglycerol--glycerol-3-phosphate 3-phosphatidyltransferase [Verrucomicrobiota bacterium]|nr:CDP-diacylglycerol--glycerol-3-phosphate 3-phosphatidyltransferase [Verrucomicrobiota bacterium]
MNLPNCLTLARVPLMFVIVGLMQYHWLGAASLAFGLFIIGAVSDWLDGYLARRRNLVSNFGKYMDALTDKIFVLGLMIAFVDSNTLPIFLVLLILCREFLITGMRMVAASKGVVFAAERGGKQKTVTQLIALGFLLFLPMLQTDLAHFLPWDLNSFADGLHRAGLMIFIVATFFTLWSGYRYFIKYRRVVFGEPAK